MKSLLDSATSTGKPSAASSGSRRDSSSECAVVFWKSWPGSTISRRRAHRHAIARSVSARQCSTTAVVTSGT
jgi:hypothetical protein